jgi:polyhydroxybutyrate depolymerase
VKFVKMAVALATVAGIVGISAPMASAATSGCSLAPTSGLSTVSLGNQQYQLYVPSGLTGSSVPLLVSLHGAGSNGTEDELSTGWDSFAAANNFIVAYPDASIPYVPSAPYLYGGVWDPYTVGSASGPFVDSVVSNIESKYCVDPTHVYVDGWSNGAVMSQRMACDDANIFAAADSYAGGDPTVWADSGLPAGNFTGEGCTPSRPMPVSLIVGQEDFTYAGLSEDAALWEGIDQCGSTPTTETDQYGSSSTYNCAAGSQVYTRVVNLTSHNWPFGAQQLDQQQRIWNFFMAHPLP